VKKRFWKLVSKPLQIIAQENSTDVPNEKQDPNTEETKRFLLELRVAENIATSMGDDQKNNIELFETYLELLKIEQETYIVDSIQLTNSIENFKKNNIPAIRSKHMLEEHDFGYFAKRKTVTINQKEMIDIWTYKWYMYAKARWIYLYYKKLKSQKHTIAEMYQILFTENGEGHVSFLQDICTNVQELTKRFSQQINKNSPADNSIRMSDRVQQKIIDSFLQWKQDIKKNILECFLRLQVQKRKNLYENSRKNI